MSLAKTLERVQADVRDHHWSIVTEAELGMRGLARTIVERLYTPEALPPEGDTRGPVGDRYRAKDFCVYWDIGDYRSLQRAPEGPGWIGVDDRARTVHRVDFVGCPGCESLIRAQLAFIPPELQQPAGTWGVHTFRSFSNVVDSPHKDDFEYGLVYVLDRIGDGGVSYLLANDQSTVLLEHQLQPGEMLIFKDSEFFHGATPLEGDDRRRDALVIQINAPEDLAVARAEGLL